MQSFDLKKIGAIVALVLVVAIIGLYKTGYLDNIVAESTTTTTPTTSSGEVFSDTRTATAPNVTVQSVNIEAPPLPVNPVRKGVAMLGPSGLFLYIVDTDGRNTKLVKKGLQNELIQENIVDPNDIKNGLKKYINEMYKNGVNNPANVQFITASSTANLPQVSKILTQLKEMGVIVTMTTATQEGLWAFNATVAPQYRDKALLVDITPSITRITGQQNGALRTIVANVGSKNTADVSAVADVVRQFPGKQYCFFIWAAAENDLRGGAPAFSGIPIYNGSDTSILRGLSIVDTALKTSNAQGVFSWETGYPMGFLGVK